MTELVGKFHVIICLNCNKLINSRFALIYSTDHQSPTAIPMEEVVAECSRVLKAITTVVVQ